MDKQQPIAFHELFYPLLQAYDSIAVRSDIELGGTNQTLQRSPGSRAAALLRAGSSACPDAPSFLLEGTDGEKKMSKSYNNYIALKDEPTEMFGKCMRIPDELIREILRFDHCALGRSD